MQPIQGFEQVQAIHGRRQTRLTGGAYVVVIQAANEDLTGYGNQCLKVVYDVAEGECAGIFADLAGDPEQNWRHEVEIDLQEANGARLKTLVEAVQASNPGWTWTWDERTLVGRFVGLVLQERKVTNKRGKRKGQTSTYLDFWDAVSIDAVRAGTVEIPPVNDQRDPDAQQQQQPVAAPPQVRAQAQQPVPAQQLVQPQQVAYTQPSAPNVQHSVPQVPVPQITQQQMPQQQPQMQVQMPQPQVQQPQQPQQPVVAGYQTPVYQQQPVAQVPHQVVTQQQPDVYDDDIPF